MRLPTCVIALLLTTSAFAEEWPGWRGPRGDGTSTETGIPLTWSQTENVLWSVPVPGLGHSSPIVWGDRIFLTSCRENKQERILLCLDRKTGKTLWERTVLTSPLGKKHKLNNYASATPATDGKYVWASFLDYTDADKPTIQLACYDMDGTKVWQKSPGEFYSVHGFCSPPILYKDLVILNGDQDAKGAARAYLVALEKTTGKEVWRTDRPNRIRSYCPPFITEAGGKTQMVLSGAKTVASYDPDTGKQIWTIDGPTEQFVASLVYHDGLFFLTAGFPEYHYLAIRPDGTGNVTKTHIAWRDTKGAGYVPSPVAANHHFFLVKDDGIATCLEAKTGAVKWQKRLGKHHSASPVYADGHLFFPDDSGRTFVLQAGPKFEVVATNDLEEECYASPAVAHGQLFIRTLGHLYCIGKSAK